VPDRVPDNLEALLYGFSEVDTVSGGEKLGPSALKENSGQRAGPVPRGTGTVVVPLVRVDNEATSNRPYDGIQSGLVELLLRL
jgi:hypothetical protein